MTTETARRRVRRVVWGVLAALIVGVVAACGSDPTATPVPTSTPTLVPGEPTPTPTPAPPAWQVTWEETPAAAQEEGELVAGLGGGASRTLRPWYQEFGDKYGINIIVSGGSGRETAARLLAERDAGKYTLDVLQAGSGTTNTILLPNKVLDPVAPQLFLPEVVDPAGWYLGKHWWGDPESIYTFLMAGNHDNPGISVNTDLFHPDDITSYRDLLKPEFHGMIVTGPLDAGSSGSTNYMYSHPDLGPEFLRQLILETDLARVDFDTAVNWLVEGKRGVATFIGNRSNDVEALQGLGAPVAELVSTMAEGSVVDSGGSSPSIMLVNQAPHAAAARLFINWALSIEGQTSFIRIAENDSFRIDIPKDLVPPQDRRREGVIYYFPSNDPLFTENLIESQLFVAELVREWTAMQ